MSISRPILGESKPVLELIKLINKVAPSKTNILIIGESGTGKELVARMLHDAGALKGKPFVPVNCGAIPENLIESELFGHRRGSFTGAVAEKIGLFEVAHTGTLFLDEVGELPLSMQVKLLRAIQERSFRKVGGTEDVKVDVRIIAATNRDLEAGVKAGTFREDLYYRLNVILLKTPPLRERRGDVPILAEAFLSKCAKKFGRDIKSFHPDALQALEAYPFPGNVRELENLIERAVTLETTDQIQLGSLPSQFSASLKAPKSAQAYQTQTVTRPDFSQGPIQLEQVLEEIEKQYLIAALEATGGVKKRAAELLGITFRSIRYRLQKLGMDAGEEESES